jgi:hypothetical protein
MEMILHESVRNKLTDLVKELSSQKDAIEDHPGLASFEEQVAQVEEFIEYAEWGLAYDIILSWLEDGNFLLSGKNALSLTWLGLYMSCKAQRNGSICI